MVGLTVHTKRSLLLCPQHLQFPGEELHGLLDTLALSHRHLGHTGRERTEASVPRDTRALAGSCDHPQIHSPSGPEVTLETTYQDPLVLKRRRQGTTVPENQSTGLGSPVQ